MNGQPESGHSESNPPEKGSEALLARLHDLLTLQLHGDPTAAELAELERLVGEHAELRRFYVRYMRQTALLRWQLGEATGSTAVISLEATKDVSPAPRPAAIPQQKSAGWLGEVIHGFAQQPLAAAILVIAILSGGILAWNFSQLPPRPGLVNGQPDTLSNVPGVDQQQPPALRDEKQKKRSVVARLKETRAATWGEATWTAGSQIHAGEHLALKNGLAEIVFESGVSVVLEGPAEIEVGSRRSEVGMRKSEEISSPHSAFPVPPSANSCVLTLGKLVARVPKQAHGFTVQSPSLNIVDLGTEFAVSVLGPAVHRTTTVHVLRGEVSVRSATHEKSTPTSDLTILRAGEAVISEPGKLALRTIKAEPTQFVRELPSAVVADSIPDDTVRKPVLRPGDILAVSRHALTLVKIDPRTGAQTLLAQGERNVHGAEWMSVVVDSQRRVYVGAGGFPGTKPGPGSSVLGVDPRTGAIRVIARGGPLSQGRINGIATAADGAIYVSVDGHEDAIVKIDPASGAASVVAHFGNNAWGIALDSNGSDLIAVSDASGMVARLSGTTVTPWVYGQDTKGARGVAVRPDGRVFVSAYSDPGRKIVELDRQLHRVTLIATLPPQQNAAVGMLAVEPDGNLILGSYGDEGQGRVYRIDVEKGTAAVIAADGNLWASGGVAVVPSPTPNP